jgi:4-hydroxybenzoate polyprenyltransferase
MKGTIRALAGMALLFAAASVNDTVSDVEFLIWSLGFAIPGALLAFSGVRAINREADQTIDSLSKRG